MRSWFALYVRSHHEKIVEAQLVGKQQVVFLPMYSSRRKWADRWKTISLPLFPGYVFCQFEPEQRSSVLATSGVIDLVRAGAEPAPIASSELEAIRRVAASPLLVEPYANLVAGERVMMTGGPLNGLSGVIVEIRKSLRFVISVELLQRSVLVEIDREWVAPYQPVKRAYSQLIGPHLRAAS